MIRTGRPDGAATWAVYSCRPHSPDGTTSGTTRNRTRSNSTTRDIVSGHNISWPTRFEPTTHPQWDCLGYMGQIYSCRLDLSITLSWVFLTFLPTEKVNPGGFWSPVKTVHFRSPFARLDAFIKTQKAAVFSPARFSPPWITISELPAFLSVRSNPPSGWINLLGHNIDSLNQVW